MKFSCRIYIYDPLPFFFLLSPQVKNLYFWTVIIKRGNLQPLPVVGEVGTKAELAAHFPLSCQNNSLLLSTNCMVWLNKTKVISAWFPANTKFHTEPTSSKQKSPKISKTKEKPPPNNSVPQLGERPELAWRFCTDRLDWSCWSCKWGCLWGCTPAQVMATPAARPPASGHGHGAASAAAARLCSGTTMCCCRKEQPHSHLGHPRIAPGGVQQQIQPNGLRGALQPVGPWRWICWEVVTLYKGLSRMLQSTHINCSYYNHHVSIQMQLCRTFILMRKWFSKQQAACINTNMHKHKERLRGLQCHLQRSARHRSHLLSFP